LIRVEWFDVAPEVDSLDDILHETTLRSDDVSFAQAFAECPTRERVGQCGVAGDARRFVIARGGGRSV
jgi:hypothetical protein